MKKSFLCFFALLLILAMILPTFSACSDTDEQESESATGIESGTLTENEHLSPENQSNTPNATETEKLTEGPTDELTEEPTEEPGEAPTETEKPTEAPTETDKETEAETEPPVSLKFVSYDNGTCAVTGIGNYTDAYVIIPERSPQGDIVTVIEDKAFFENTAIKALQIPSTVMSIGNLAFGGCSSLVYISVDPNNKAYTDVNGVLYSKDKSRLIYFPSASQASEIFISVNVTEIMDMAFYNTPSLKYIKYGGTLSDWNKIKIGDKNYGIYSASLSFAVTE